MSSLFTIVVVLTIFITLSIIPKTNAESNVMEIAQNTTSLSTLVTAIQSADLTDVLSSEGPFTVFAPNDDAFTDFTFANPELASLLFTKGFQFHLEDLLLYHMTYETYSTQDLNLMDEQPITMINEEDIVILTEDCGLDVIDACLDIIDSQGYASKVREPLDIAASNGLIHIVDKVLQPSFLDMNAGEYIAQFPFLTIFASLLERVDLTWYVQSFGDPTTGFTIMAPYDKAFENITLEELSDEDVTSILQNHIVPQSYPSNLLPNGMIIDTVLGTQLTITFTQESYYESYTKVNDSKILKSDVLVSNGIVHILDKVLIPEQSCDKVFCNDGVTNGDFVLTDAGGISCNQLKQQLAALDSNDEQCKQAKMAEPLCCPTPLEQQECFLCGDKGPMTKPNQVIPGLDTCQQVDDSILSLYPENDCDTVKNEYFSFLDIAAYCGCQGFDPPNLCDPLCDDDQIVNEDAMIPQEEEDDVAITCKDGLHYSKFVTVKEVCDANINIPENKAACCTDKDNGGGKGGVNNESGALSSNYSMATVLIVIVVLMTNYVH